MPDEREGALGTGQDPSSAGWSWALGCLFCDYVRCYLEKWHMSSVLLLQFFGILK